MKKPDDPKHIPVAVREFLVEWLLISDAPEKALNEYVANLDEAPHLLDKELYRERYYRCKQELQSREWRDMTLPCRGVGHVPIVDAATKELERYVNRLLPPRKMFKKRHENVVAELERRKMGLTQQERDKQEMIDRHGSTIRDVPTHELEEHLSWFKDEEIRIHLLQRKNPTILLTDEGFKDLIACDTYHHLCQQWAILSAKGSVREDYETDRMSRIADVLSQRGVNVINDELYVDEKYCVKPNPSTTMTTPPGEWHKWSATPNTRKQAEAAHNSQRAYFDKMPPARREEFIKQVAAEAIKPAIITKPADPINLSYVDLEDMVKLVLGEDDYTPTQAELEPECRCKNLSLGHAPDCAWKQWKDGV